MKLSICIATFNRADFIGTTLDSITSQVTDQCEIVISDNASTDETGHIVASYARRFPCIRYFRQESNKGIDRNFDSAVQLAHGEFCWLFTDDDLMKPGAIDRVLSEIHENLSLIVVNIELWDINMSHVIRPRWIDYQRDRRYGVGDTDRILSELDATLINVDNLIIRREIWMAHNPERYYGTLIGHFGTIFQKRLPGEALLISEPLVNYRLGNAQTFSSRWMEILLGNWVAVIDSLELSEPVRRNLKSRYPWRYSEWLVAFRAWGPYGIEAYWRWVRPQLESKWDAVRPLVFAVMPKSLCRLISEKIGADPMHLSGRSLRSHLLHRISHSGSDRFATSCDAEVVTPHSTPKE